MGGLARPGSILLLSTYELGHAPHALAQMSASLEAAGFAPRCVDLAVDELTRSAARDATLIVFSTPMHTALRLAIEALDAIEQAAPSPRRRIAFVGLYAALHHETLDALGVDWALGGEYEAALVELVRALDRAETPAPARITLRRQSLAVPARNGLPDLSRYARFIDADGEAHLAGYTESTRGCLERCRHCPVPAIYDGRLVAVDRDVVLADIDAQVRSGARHITFGDPDFLNGPTHALRVCRELHRRWPLLTFDFTAQVANLLEHREVAAELVDLGCAFAVTAVESLSDIVLEKLAKRHRAADVDALLELAASIGLALRPTLLPFTPWTAMGDIVRLVDWIADHDLAGNVAPVQLSVRLLVPPGSLLAGDEFGPIEARSLVHPWTHADPRMDALAADIGAIVESAGDDETQTHDAIRRRVYDAAARRAPSPPPPTRRRIPRVSEPWFC